MKRVESRNVTLCLLVAPSLLGACSSPPTRQPIGMATGGVVGAVVTGGSTVGAVAGTATGGVTNVEIAGKP
ncbi:MAG: glycine zipper 2TM domain-containing protein [Burkholderiales bacterium]